MIDGEILLQEAHLVSHIREKTSDEGSQMNHKRWLDFFEQLFRLFKISQVSILTRREVELDVSLLKCFGQEVI